MKLPISMDPSNYGTIKLQNFMQENGLTFERFLVINGSKTFMIDVYNELGINKVTMLGNINLTWTDTLIENNSFSLRR